MKKYYEVVDVKDNVEVDLVIFEDDQDLNTFENGLKDEYKLREIPKEEIMDALEEWFLFYQDESRGKELIGGVGVDSGMLMISDPCYIKEATSEKCEEIGAAFGKEKVAQIMNGFVMGIKPPNGDGIYDVYAKEDYQGQIISIEISFI